MAVKRGTKYEKLVRMTAMMPAITKELALDLKYERMTEFFRESAVHSASVADVCDPEEQTELLERSRIWWDGFSAALNGTHPLASGFSDHRAGYWNKGYQRGMRCKSAYDLDQRELSEKNLPDPSG